MGAVRAPIAFRETIRGKDRCHADHASGLFQYPVADIFEGRLDPAQRLSCRYPNMNLW